MHARWPTPRSLVIFAAVALAGCTLPPSAGERQARQDVMKIGETLRPTGAKPALPVLTAESTLPEFARFAVLNHPEVGAAFDEWRAAVLAIAPTRALPDPQLTFEADIADMVMTLMPGLMFDFMSAGKRSAMAQEALANGNIAYRAYVADVLRVTARVRKAWLEIAFIEEALRWREEARASLDQAIAMANADYTTGRGMGNFEVQVRLANEVARMRVELSTLTDRQEAARWRWKSALGLRPDDPDPVWPRAALAATPLPTADELWRRAAEVNPEIGRMRAMVEMAVANVEVASAARIPDFTLGAMVDLKAEPRMTRPTATLTLPIWRERIRATIASAEARRDAAQARVAAEQINLAAEIAQMLFMIREGDRMIAYIDESALPNYERAIASIEAGYQSGMTSPGMIAETRVMASAMRLERSTALRDREIAVTDLLLMTAAGEPADAPLLPAPSRAAANLNSEP